MPGGGVARGIRGGAWMAGVSLAVALVGFVYWLVMARIAGVAALGEAASVISGAGVASSIVGAGLGLAIIAVSSEGAAGLAAIIVYSVSLSLLAGLLAYLLSFSFKGLAFMGLLLGFLGLLSACFMNLLVSLSAFRAYFLVGLGSAVSRLAVGVALVLAGLGVAGILAGYLAPSILSLLLAAPLTVKLWRRGAPGLRRGLSRLASAHLANYPYGFSQQLALMLTVYAYSALGGGAASVGSLYLLLMVELVLVSLPFSTMLALIPLTQGGGFTHEYRESYRLTAPISLLAASLLLIDPSAVLSLISPRLDASASLLPLLLLSMTPLMHVQLAITWLNRRGDRRGVALVGGLRAAALLALVPLLLRYGVEGVAVAWVTANLAAAVLGGAVTRTLGTLVRLLAVNALFTVYYAGHHLAVALPLLVVTALWMLGITSPEEMVQTLLSIITGRGGGVEAA